MMNLVPHLVAWAVLATIVVFLAIYRRRVYMKSDEVLHLMDAEAPQLSAQETVGKKLEKLDFWGKLLTVLVFLYGLGIAGFYVYSRFTDTATRM